MKSSTLTISLKTQTEKSENPTETRFLSPPMKPSSSRYSWQLWRPQKNGPCPSETENDPKPIKIV